MQSASKATSRAQTRSAFSETKSRCGERPRPSARATRLTRPPPLFPTKPNRQKTAAPPSFRSTQATPSSPQAPASPARRRRTKTNHAKSCSPENALSPAALETASSSQAARSSPHVARVRREGCLWLHGPSMAKLRNPLRTWLSSDTHALKLVIESDILISLVRLAKPATSASHSPWTYTQSRAISSGN